MEAEGSLLCSQEPTTGHYPEKETLKWEMLVLWHKLEKNFCIYVFKYLILRNIK